VRMEADAQKIFLSLGNGKLTFFLIWLGWEVVFGGFWWILMDVG